jgi:1-acyl-sn-glycerol-3-phosphate acyltransferase
MEKQPLQIRDKTIFDSFIGKFLLKLIFMMWFKIKGWKPTERAPEGAGITIAAPHTSNWDFIYALGAALLLDIKMYYSIKDTWCKVPVLGRFMLWLGAIPINRSGGASGQVAQIRQFVERHKERRVFFLFTPEGTRGSVDKWKTGFYHVAEECGLPIFLAKVDYLNKRSGVFHSYQLTGDKVEDVQAIQASYKRICGKFPALQYPAYIGPVPELNDAEAAIMKAMYSFKGVATKMDIAAKAKLAGLAGMSTKMLDFLIEKGVLEHAGKTDCELNEPMYRLTFAGKGCLLHLFPTLASHRKETLNA